MARRPVRRRGDVFQVRLDEEGRDVLRELCGQLRALLDAEDPSSDTGVARLFPPAYPDDPLRNFDFERTAAPDLLATKLAALDTLRRTADASELTEEEVLAWLGSVNSMRLVLGTRLDLNEDTTHRDYPDEPERSTFALYAYLTWLEDGIVDALAIA